MAGAAIPHCLAVAAVAGLLSLTACETGPMAEEQVLGFSMEPSHDRIMAGETVTFTTTSENTLGRDANVRWNAAGGTVKASDNGRTAQVTFDNPGTYLVSADLMVDGRRMQTQTETIVVQPLTVPGEADGPDALSEQ